MYRCKLTEREQRIKQIDLFGRYIGVRVVEGCEDLANDKDWGIIMAVMSRRAGLARLEKKQHEEEKK